jgi:hypothetical protein
MEKIHKYMKKVKFLLGFTKEKKGEKKRKKNAIL